MTENKLRINGKSFDETISLLEEFMESDDVHGELFTVLRSARDFMENLNEEIQQYRAIGAIEEFKALKEKNEPKEVAYQFDTIGHKHEKCPACGSFHVFGRHCTECGQSIIEWWNLNAR